MSITKINNLGITDGTIVNADISASAAIASTKLTGVNDAKAWVNFDGTGTPAIRASFNVTSITDNGTGDYTVNFTNALTDANYAIAGFTNFISANAAGLVTQNSSYSPATGSVAIKTVASNSAVLIDCSHVNIAVFR